MTLIEAQSIGLLTALPVVVDQFNVLRGFCCGPQGFDELPHLIGVSHVGLVVNAAEPSGDIGIVWPLLQPLACTLNGIASSCRTEPAANDGFRLYFSHGKGPIFSFTPVGVPTTDRREMVDGSGQRWAMSGHHSFELEEIGGNGNRITVSSP